MLNQDELIIGNKSFTSRLITGSGKYKSLQDMVQSLAKSESEMVTVAIRRLNLLDISKNNNLITAINWKNFWLLPNTAGAKTTDEAIRLAFLGRELAKRIGQEENNFIKLSSYECGFQPFEDSRQSFNIEFYLVGILFVIFETM